MNIIYCCQDGIHFSQVMAAIHLRQLPQDKIPSAPELLFFQGSGSEEKKLGFVQYRGEDCSGNSIFTLAVKKEFKIVRKSVADFLKIYNVPADNLLLVQPPKIDSPWIPIGGYLNDLGACAAGHLLVVNSIRKNYLKLVSKVKEVMSLLD